MLVEPELLEQSFVLGRVVLLKCPLTIPSHLSFFFCLIMSGGSNDQREGAKQIKASAVAEATPRIKGPMAVPARVGTTVVFPWHDTLKATGATPHRWTPRHAGPSSCSGGLPAKKQVCTLPCSLTAFNTNKILHYY